ncbi:MAG: hypothetical protein MUO82_11610, partial [Candidatus Thermoplasmatota archaeon]|nr:hypothetical protein [Candidatus Thermoplasmatota archaeon]
MKMNLLKYTTFGVILALIGAGAISNINIGSYNDVAIASGTNNNKYFISLSFDFTLPTISQEQLLNETLDIVTIADGNNEKLPLMANPGEPYLPYKMVYVLLPPGGTVENIQYDKIVHNFPGSYDIMPAGHPVINTEEKTYDELYDKIFRNEDVYSSSADFPSITCSVGPVMDVRGFSIVKLFLRPIIYNPNYKELKYYS